MHGGSVAVRRPLTGAMHVEVRHLTGAWTLKFSRAYDPHRWEHDMERRTFVSLPAAMAAAPLVSVVGEPAQSLAAARSPLAAPDSLTFESPSVIVDNLPVFYEQLKDDLTFPLAWRNAQIRSFGQWRRTARAKV